MMLTIDYAIVLDKLDAGEEPTALEWIALDLAFDKQEQEANREA